MAKDYSGLRATAQRLVENFGRPVTFVLFEDDPADPAKPWRGAADPRSPAESEIAGSAVAVPPSSASQLGLRVDHVDFVKRSDQILIAFAETDIEEYDEVLDSDGVRYKIEGVEKLRPAETTLLFFVGVRR